MRNIQKALPLFFTFLLVLSACGGSEDSQASEAAEGSQGDQVSTSAGVIVCETSEKCIENYRSALGKTSLNDALATFIPYNKYDFAFAEDINIDYIKFFLGNNPTRENSVPRIFYTVDFSVEDIDSIRESVENSDFKNLTLSDADDGEDYYSFLSEETVESDTNGKLEMNPKEEVTIILGTTTVTVRVENYLDSNEAAQLSQSYGNWGDEESFAPADQVPVEYRVGPPLFGVKGQDPEAVELEIELTYRTEQKESSPDLTNELASELTGKGWTISETQTDFDLGDPTLLTRSTDNDFNVAALDIWEVGESEPYRLISYSGFFARS